METLGNYYYSMLLGLSCCRRLRTGSVRLVSWMGGGLMLTQVLPRGWPRTIAFKWGFSAQFGFRWFMRIRAYLHCETPSTSAFVPLLWCKLSRDQ